LPSDAVDYAWLLLVSELRGIFVKTWTGMTTAIGNPWGHSNNPWEVFPRELE